MAVLGAMATIYIHMHRVQLLKGRVYVIPQLGGWTWKKYFEHMGSTASHKAI